MVRYSMSQANKLTICKSALIAENLPKLGGAPVADFYFDNRADVGKQSISGMVPSLLMQLAVTHPQRLKLLSELYSEFSERNQSGPPLPNMVKCLKDMLAVNSRVFLVVDALDEHIEFSENSEYDRNALLDLITDFSKFSNVRILVSSRDQPGIRDVLTQSDQLQLNIGNSPQQTDDIKAYIEDRLNTREFEQWNEGDKSKIKERLFDNGRQTM